MAPSINDINFSNQLLLIDDLLKKDKVKIEIGFWGSRTVIIEGYSDSISLNDFLWKIIASGYYENVDQLSSAKRLAGQRIVHAIGSSKGSLNKQYQQELGLCNSFAQSLVKMEESKEENKNTWWQINEYIANCFQSYNEPMFRLAFGLAPEDSIKKHPAYSRREGSRIFARYVAPDDLMYQKIRKQDEKIQQLNNECASKEKAIDGLKDILDFSALKIEEFLENKLISEANNGMTEDAKKLTTFFSEIRKVADNLIEASVDHIMPVQSTAPAVHSIKLDMLKCLGISASGLEVHEKTGWVEIKVKEDNLYRVPLELADGRRVEADLSKEEFNILKSAFTNFISGIIDTSSLENAEKILTRCFYPEQNMHEAKGE